MPSTTIVNYDLITFNYDTILETLAYNIEKTLTLMDKKNLNTEEIDNHSIRYCKLHGSIEKDNIIPPTWAKTNIPQIERDWIDAQELLKNANEIRIIGFSFPETDNHISYLLKSALIENKNLKSLDVICLDQNDIVKTRYRSIFTTDKFRFVSKSVGELFDCLVDKPRNKKENYNQSDLEMAHAKIFESNTPGKTGGLFL
jgi:hypothetical protein